MINSSHKTLLPKMAAAAEEEDEEEGKEEEEGGEEGEGEGWFPKEAPDPLLTVPETGIRVFAPRGGASVPVAMVIHAGTPAGVFTAPCPGLSSALPSSLLPLSRRLAPMSAP
ncbi:hypothetical protein ACOMHN_014433 [Nucella lapillus]